MFIYTHGVAKPPSDKPTQKFIPTTTALSIIGLLCVCIFTWLVIFSWLQHWFCIHFWRLFKPLIRSYFGLQNHKGWQTKIEKNCGFILSLRFRLALSVHVYWINTQTVCNVHICIKCVRHTLWLDVYVCDCVCGFSENAFRNFHEKYDSRQWIDPQNAH